MPVTALKLPMKKSTTALHVLKILARCNCRVSSELCLKLMGCDRDGDNFDNDSYLVSRMRYAVYGKLTAIFRL